MTDPTSELPGQIASEACGVPTTPAHRVAAWRHRLHGDIVYSNIMFHRNPVHEAYQATLIDFAAAGAAVSPSDYAKEVETLEECLKM
jgi:tRNA A-37 threonylcarbamoyl transferase component Bud32